MSAISPRTSAFSSGFVGTVTTLRRDGSPHSTIVWVDEDAGDIVFNTAEGSSKPRELRADPRVAMLVLDPADTYRWLAVSGTAELTQEGAREQIDRLAKKYLGADTYPFRREGEVRVAVRIRPDRISSQPA